MSRQYKDFPYVPYPTYTCIDTPLSTLHIRVVYLWISMHHCHPKPVAYLGDHCCVMHSVYLDRNIITCIQHYSIMQINFTAKEVLCAPHVHPSLVHPSPGNHWSFYCFHHFAFSRMSCVWTLYVAFSDWLFSLSNTHLRFFHVFLRLESSFLLITE